MRLFDQKRRGGEKSRVGQTGRRMIIVGAAILVQACGSDAVDAPTGGFLSGTVQLQDAWGNDLPDFSGVAVTVDGGSAQAVTDKSGAWTITNLPDGKYDITLKKATFGTMRILGQDVAGPSTVTAKVGMAVTPTVQAIIDSIHVSSLSGTDFYFVDGHLSAPPPANSKQTTAIIFVSAKGDAVSPDPATYDQWNASFGVGGTLEFTMLLPVDGTRATFGAGTTLFIAGYANSAVCSCYDDPVTKKRVFSNTGPRGNVVRLTVQ